MTFRIRKRSRLPHWDVDNGSYFITTSLADAVPREVRIRIDEERKPTSPNLSGDKGE